MQTASTSSSKAVWPLAAICCLALILFLISAAVVLALIPVYLPRKDLTPSDNLENSNAPFFLEYSGSDFDNEDDAIAGKSDDPDAVRSALGFPADVKVTDVLIAPTSVDRRKRSFYGSRSKRAITVKILLIVNFVTIKSSCNFQCITTRKNFITSATSKSFSNIKISINGGPLVGKKTPTLSMKCNGLVRTRPSGFPGPASSLEFTTIKSGEFTDTSIWSEGILPNGNCTIVIAAGTVVTLSRPGLGIRARLISIFGTLIIGGGNSVFTFKNAVNIKIRKGGKLQDATTTKCLRVPRNSVVTMYLGGGFGEAGTTIQSYTSSGDGESFKITNPNGPFTCAILPSGTLRQASKIMFFAVLSGPFKSGATYCGGSAPTADDCSDSPCGLEVLSGVILSTADLNGLLDINIDELFVAFGATLQLGTPGSSAGFKFKFPIKLSSAGTLSFVASGGNILLPIGSIFAILAGGNFISVVATSLQVYDPITGILGAIFDLGLSMGSFSVSLISIDSIIEIIIDGITVPVPTTTPSATVIPG